MRQELISAMVECGIDLFKAEQAAGRIVNMFNQKVNEALTDRDGLTENEKALAAYLLRLAQSEFANDGLSDVKEEAWDGWTIEERKEFVKSYYESEGQPQLFDENDLNLNDRVLMAFLAGKLKK